MKRHSSDCKTFNHVSSCLRVEICWDMEVTVDGRKVLTRSPLRPRTILAYCCGLCYAHLWLAVQPFLLPSHPTPCKRFCCLIHQSTLSDLVVDSFKRIAIEVDKA